ncbi:hypothetical protein [Pseudomonas beijingensis]|jgi:hypothetical protein|uniref:hypothetical protein n=1 Tax=Pseudomonas beijingensis TaxID=2954101 RepID=UPI002732FC10|nr:hypothetical protein [Pseudomonas sp. FP2262]WLH43738.1 hypothetical protein PSH83_15190 [Pseudomonas sp. FP2262]
MNIFTKIGAGLLVVAVQAMTVVLAQGSIQLYQKGSIEDPGDTCSLEIGTEYKAYNFRDDSTNDCTNDKYSFFTLYNVDSAVWIAFGSEYDCRKVGSGYSGDWYYRVKTYIQPTNSTLISIPGTLRSATPGQLLKPGVMFVDGKNINNENVEGKLSCVYIWPGTPVN